MFDHWIRKILWKGKWQPEFHGQRSLVGYGPWGRKESDMAEQLTQAHTEELLEVQHGSRYISRS